jgi:hypothetical protein
MRKLFAMLVMATLVMPFSVGCQDKKTTEKKVEKKVEENGDTKKVEETTKTETTDNKDEK